MKLNRYGFTLTELLVVIILLAVITIVSVPTISNIVKNNEIKNVELAIQNVISLADLYSKENTEEIIWKTYNDKDEYTCISIKELVDTGILKKDAVKVLDFGNLTISDRDINENNYEYYSVRLIRDKNMKSISNREIVNTNVC